MKRRFLVAELDEIEGVGCPCGTAQRAFTEDPSGTASFHLVEISSDSRRHYHKQMTEIYYVLDGSGTIELDDEVIDAKPGTAVMIKPGCRHRATGNLSIINVVIPAFDPADEWFD